TNEDHRRLRDIMNEIQSLEERLARWEQILGNQQQQQTPENERRRSSVNRRGADFFGDPADGMEFPEPAPRQRSSASTREQERIQELTRQVETSRQRLQELTVQRNDLLGIEEEPVAPQAMMPEDMMMMPEEMLPGGRIDPRT